MNICPDDLTVDKLYRFDWDHEESIVGAFCRRFPDGWILINFFGSDLTPDGFHIFNEHEVLCVTELDAENIHVRANPSVKYDQQGITGSASDFRSCLDLLVKNWKIIGIYNKRDGYGSLEIGVKNKVTDHALSYEFVTTEAKLDGKETVIRFDEILALSFGGRYEAALYRAIGPGRLEPPLT
ncbi:MAG: hypothetical protein EOP85_12210 [Verrucomicrobiaceae bacterium]|nr:MAG: hypothetical protein EOP85_12210 [Verrucomicrobiaceae bacterium]